MSYKGQQLLRFPNEEVQKLTPEEYLQEAAPSLHAHLRARYNFVSLRLQTGLEQGIRLALAKLDSLPPKKQKKMKAPFRSSVGAIMSFEVDVERRFFFHVNGDRILTLLWNPYIYAEHWYAAQGDIHRTEAEWRHRFEQNQTGNHTGRNHPIAVPTRPAGDAVRG